MEGEVGRGETAIELWRRNGNPDESVGGGVCDIKDKVPMGPYVRIFDGPAPTPFNYRCTTDDNCGLGSSRQCIREGLKAYGFCSSA